MQCYVIVKDIYGFGWGFFSSVFSTAVYLPCCMQHLEGCWERMLQLFSGEVSVMSRVYKDRQFFCLA